MPMRRLTPHSAAHRISELNRFLYFLLFKGNMTNHKIQLYPSYFLGAKQPLQLTLSDRPHVQYNSQPAERLSLFGALAHNCKRLFFKDIITERDELYKFSCDS